MAQTTALISEHLSIELANLVLSFFDEPTNEFDCAASGLWEYCLNISNVENGLHGACYGGNFLIAKKMMRGGATRLKTALRFAIKGGHLDLIKYMVKNDAEVGTDYIYFERRHSIKIAQYFVKNCDVNINDFLLHVVFSGNYSATKYLVENGATNLNDAVSKACRRRWFVSRQSKKLERMTDIQLKQFINGPRASVYQKILNLLVKKGATACSCSRTIEEHVRLAKSLPK
jgi:hypothetical protein